MWCGRSLVARGALLSATSKVSAACLFSMKKVVEKINYCMGEIVKLDSARQVVPHCFVLRNHRFPACICTSKTIPVSARRAPATLWSAPGFRSRTMGRIKSLMTTVIVDYSQPEHHFGGTKRQSQTESTQQIAVGSRKLHRPPALICEY